MSEPENATREGRAYNAYTHVGELLSQQAEDRAAIRAMATAIKQLEFEGYEDNWAPVMGWKHYLGLLDKHAAAIRRAEGQ